MGPALPHPSTPPPVQPPPARPRAPRVSSRAGSSSKSKGVPRLGQWHVPAPPPHPHQLGDLIQHGLSPFQPPFRAPGSRAQGTWPEAWTHPAAPKGEATPWEDTALGLPKALLSLGLRGRRTSHVSAQDVGVGNSSPARECRQLPGFRSCSLPSPDSDPPLPHPASSSPIFSSLFCARTLSAADPQK